MTEAELLLRRLTSGDEQCLQALLAPTPQLQAADLLDRRTLVLVRLAALLAVGAPTTSLRWAVELAAAAGADDAAVGGVLVSTARALGAAQVVLDAPRLALALGLEPEPVTG